MARKPGVESEVAWYVEKRAKRTESELQRWVKIKSRTHAEAHP